MAQRPLMISDWILPEQRKILGMRAMPATHTSADDGNLWSVRQESAPEEWIAEQKRLAKLCVTEDRTGSWSIGKKGAIEGLERVAGVDVSFFPDKEHAVVTVAVLSFPKLELVYERCVTMRLTMPYVPGFLAFREAPACAALLDSLPAEIRPQAVLVDGNGIFHPRRCGCATHLGVSLGIPCIGVAKTIHEVDDVTAGEVRKIARTLERPGRWAPVKVDGESRAAVLWPCWEAKDPLVVSVGHLVSLRTAAKLTIALCREEVVEPVRQADLLGRAAVKGWLAGEPLADIRILGARAHRKGVESSVLPVIRNLLARRAAEELGEDWAPVESRRQRAKRTAERGDGLLRIPGVAFTLPHENAPLRSRSRRKTAVVVSKRTLTCQEAAPNPEQLTFPILPNMPRTIGTEGQTLNSLFPSLYSHVAPVSAIPVSEDGLSDFAESTDVPTHLDCRSEFSTSSANDVPDSWESLG